MSKIDLASASQADGIIQYDKDAKGLSGKIEAAKDKRKTTEAQRRAISKYEANFKRINCRLSPELWEKIQATGESANTVIVKALSAYLAETKSNDLLTLLDSSPKSAGDAAPKSEPKKSKKIPLAPLDPN